jgi:hypothetical protein
MLDRDARVLSDENEENGENHENDEIVQVISEYSRDLPCELPGGLNASDVVA